MKILTNTAQVATTNPLTMAALLAVIAGYIDATTYLAFNGLFVAQATGSLVEAAAAFETGNPEFIKVAAIPIFLIAGIATAVMTRMAAGDKRRAMGLALAMETACVGVFTFNMLWPAGSSLIAGLSAIAAMGVQSAFCRTLLKEVGSTNVMTTNLTQLAISVEAAIAQYWTGRRDGDTTEQLSRFGTVVLAFFAGVFVGSVVYRTEGPKGLVVITVVLAVLSQMILLTRKRLAMN